MTKQEHLLECLAEECSEVAQRVSKALRFTLAEVQPGQDLTNAERIAQELNDLLAVKDLLERTGVIPRNETPFSVKHAKIQKFMLHAIENGAISDTLTHPLTHSPTHSAA